MFSGPDGVEYLNSFSLVSYIPESLAEFLDHLRSELVPNCFLRAHVTILPPRPITSPVEQACEQIREVAYGMDPIDVELTEVEIFPHTDVIYIAIGHASEDLRRMHAKLNAKHLAYDEPFEYHPHITLAQNLKTDQVDELSMVARQRWAEYKGPRSFRIDTVMFVQNTRWHGWIDLAEIALGRLVLA